MKESSTRTVLRVWFRVQIALLCTLLVIAGASIAAERTETTARGVPAAVQTDKPITPSAGVRDRLSGSIPWEYAGLLPAPVGNAVSLYMSIRNIDEQEVRELFGKLHNFFLQ